MRVAAVGRGKKIDAYPEVCTLGLGKYSAWRNPRCRSEKMEKNFDGAMSHHIQNGHDENHFGLNADNFSRNPQPGATSCTCRVHEMTCSDVVCGSSPLDCLGLKVLLMDLPSVFFSPSFGSTIFYSADDHSLEN